MNSALPTSSDYDVIMWARSRELRNGNSGVARGGRSQFYFS